MSKGYFQGTKARRHGSTQGVSVTAQGTGRPRLAFQGVPGFRGFRGFQKFRGFTLIEMMVVIAIIAIIAGLVLALSGSLGQDAVIRRTRITLGALKGIAEEYEISTGARVVHDGEPQTLPSNVELESSIQFFIWSAWQVPRTRSMVQQLQTDAFKPTNPSTGEPWRVIDGWGNPILYLEYQVYQDSKAVPISVDNSPLDDIFRPYPRPFFVSAGPDGKFGKWNYTTNAPDADAKDNLYSYDLD